MPHYLLPWSIEDGELRDAGGARFGELWAWSDDPYLNADMETCRLAAVGSGELLLRAVNCHAELVEAIYGLLDGLDANNDPEVCGLDQKQWEDRIRKAREAVAKAGRTP